MCKESLGYSLDYFEGNTNIRRTHIDHLATRFENFRMENDEFIASFSAKLSTIDNEAYVLGKKYR